MYATAMSGTGANSVGIGVNLQAVSQQFTQGNITATGNPMDLAINGNTVAIPADHGGNLRQYLRSLREVIEEFERRLATWEHGSIEDLIGKYLG